MSHIPLRKEKDCLNCGTLVQGRYCHQCGQENVVPKETFWHMVTHFFYDITHFDSSFFHTIHHLILKPGFLPEEYMNGRRASYLHPIRMYVFTSAIFFLLFFTFFKPAENINYEADRVLTLEERADRLELSERLLISQPGNTILAEKIKLLADSSRPVKVRDTVINTEGLVIDFGDKGHRSLAEYDSVQQSLPRSERDGWFNRRLARLGISLKLKYKENPGELTSKILEGFYHRLPYLLFISLPLFALILRLVYIRRKQYFFADHGVFTIHLYIFSFINLLVTFAISKLEEATRWPFLDTLTLVVFFGMAIYLLLAMRRFYKQGWGKTAVKFIIVSLVSLVMMVFLFFAFLIFSAASV